MKKTLLAFTTALLVAGLAYSEKSPVYISPNNDGKKDFLEVPFKIKENRYVKDWSFVIEDSKGNVIRTIGNKERRESKITFKTFWKALFTPKSGVSIPSSVVWNGIMDSGEVAPDGTYYYYATATDDNGNSASTEKFVVIVDNTPPEVDLAQPSSNEKIFGEGSKPVLSVRQKGSEEDSWIGVFSDATGKAVRTYKWTSSAPLNFEWNGSDDNGAPLPDGVYTYKVATTDRAGNDSAPATITNIIYSADKPATNISIIGSKYFSPNGNGVNDTISFFVKIPVPDAKSVNKLVEWSVKVVDATGNTVKTYSGTENPPSKVEFNGEDGYIKTEFLKELGGDDSSKSNTAKATIKETVNVRSTASTSGDKLGLAYAGESYEIVESAKNGWIGISFNGKTGYVKTDYVEQ